MDKGTQGSVIADQVYTKFHKIVHVSCELLFTERIYCINGIQEGKVSKLTMIAEYLKMRMLIMKLLILA
jgi:hypothetical protein